LSVPAKKWAIWADRNGPGRQEMMAMKMSASAAKNFPGEKF
jgi:hypothetical protein